MAQFVSVSDVELEQGLQYAAKKYGATLDKDTLRLLVNTAGENRQPNQKFALAVASVARRMRIPEKNQEEQYRFKAYVGATMKIFSGRSAKKRKAQAPRKKSSTEPDRPKASLKTEQAANTPAYPLDGKQYCLL